MIRFVSRGLLLGLALLAVACNNNTTTTATSPTPTNPITESFGPAQVGRNGAVTFPVAVAVAGAVTATLQSVTPDAAVVIGFALGTWNGAACQIILPNDIAVQGTSIQGNISSAGNLCVRVYDVGNLVNTETVSVTVSHL
jgi:hypothetical protein